MTRMSLPTPTLHTARLRLRPFDDVDESDLFALHSSAYVLRYRDAPPWSERVRAARFITACRQMAVGGTGARLAVVDRTRRSGDFDEAAQNYDDFRHAPGSSGTAIFRAGILEGP